MIRHLKVVPTPAQCEDAREFYSAHGDCFLAWINEGDWLASVDRSPEGEDREDGLHAEHESAVAKPDAQKRGA